MKSLPFIFAPTPLDTVQEKVLAFYEKMNQIATFLRNNNAPPELQINRKDLFLQFYIDKPAIVRLLKISTQEDFEQFGVFFGLEAPEEEEKDLDEAFGEMTACFVGLDKDRNVLHCHFPGSNTASTGDNPTNQTAATTAAVDPEDTWPPRPGHPINDPPQANVEYVKKADEEEIPRCFTLETYWREVADYFACDIKKKDLPG